MLFNEESQITLIPSIYDFIRRNLFGALYFVVISAGITGNLTSIFVFAQKKMLKCLTFRLLFFLSIFDLLILTMSAVETAVVFKFSFDLRILSGFFCKANTFLAYFLMQSRSVIFVSITLERTLMISPFKSKSPSNGSFRSNSQYRRESTINEFLVINKLRSSVRTHLQTLLDTTSESVFTQQIKSQTSVRRTRQPQPKLSPRRKLLKLFTKILSATLLAVFLMNIHFFLFIDLIENTSEIQSSQFIAFLNDSLNASDLYQNTDAVMYQCGPGKHTIYWYFLKIWFWLDMFVIFAVPLMVISVSFAYIFLRLKKINANYDNFLANKDYAPNTRIYLRKIKKNKSILRKLFIVNMSFIVCIVPFFVYSVLNQVVVFKSHYIAENVVNILYYSNHAMNFFSYGIVNHRFRHELSLLKINMETGVSRLKGAVGACMCRRTDIIKIRV